MENIPTGAWIVVADGTHARVFHNVGKDGTISLQQDENVLSDPLDAQGPSGHRPSDSSPSQNDEATFAKQIAHRLNAAALKQQFEHLVLIADPTTLGEIRPQLHVETTKRILGELAKTLTNSPLEDIEKALSSK